VFAARRVPEPLILLLAGIAGLLAAWAWAS
jgi:hypothetical protein